MLVHLVRILFADLKMDYSSIIFRTVIIVQNNAGLIADAACATYMYE